MILGALRMKLAGAPNKGSRLPAFVEERLPEADKIIPQGTQAWSLSSGMQTLTNALQQNQLNLSADSTQIHLQLNSPVHEIKLQDDKFVVKSMKNGTCESVLPDVDSIFLCCPSYQSAYLLSGLPMDADVTARLDRRNIPWASVAAAVLECDKNGAEPPVRGFGHLVPRKEDTNVLGVIYDSCAFPQLDSPGGSTIRYTVMMKPYADWLRHPDDASESTLKEIEEKALQVLHTQLKLTSARVIDRRAALHLDCIPNYPLGHLENITKVRSGMREWLRQRVPNERNIHLVGYSYDGVGLGDVVQSALNAVCAEVGVD